MEAFPFTQTDYYFKNADTILKIQLPNSRTCKKSITLFHLKDAREMAYVFYYITTNILH
jgi:hypothetical protein